MAKKTQTQKNPKKGSKILSKMLDFFCTKKRRLRQRHQLKKPLFFAYKKICMSKKSQKLKESQKRSKILDDFFDFFDFFPNFVPDLGDQFWYNRLCFWAGLRSEKKTFFSTKIWLFDFFSKWPGNQKFPSKSTVPDSKKILPEAKTLIFELFFFAKKSAKNMRFLDFLWIWLRFYRWFLTSKNGKNPWFLAVPKNFFRQIFDFSKKFKMTWESKIS